MKKGKIILGSAAFLVTAASALAFKASLKFGHPHVYGLTNANNVVCTLTTCVTGGTGTPLACATKASAVVEIAKNPGFYKTSTCKLAIQSQHNTN